MKQIVRKACYVTVLMLIAVIIAHILKPSIYTSDERPNFDDFLPREFGEWHMDERAFYEIINPKLKETLDRVYTQTVTRTYIHKSGRRIMLSIAYGADQSRDNRVHRPEVCYPAQGFSITEQKKGSIVIDKNIELPVMRLVATYGSRLEPITYWIRFGNVLVRGSVEQAFARIAFGLKGFIPDGLLFRTSEINQNSKSSYALQDEFIRELLQSLKPEAKIILIGTKDTKVELSEFLMQ
jgi:EpsI family protein